MPRSVGALVVAIVVGSSVFDRVFPPLGSTTKGPDPEATPFALAAGEIQVLSHNDDGSLELFSKRLDEMCPVAADSCGLSNVLDSTNVGSLGSQGPARCHRVPRPRPPRGRRARLRLERRLRPAAQDEGTCGDRRAVGARHDRAAVRCDRDRHAAHHDDGRRHQRITERRPGASASPDESPTASATPESSASADGIPVRLVLAAPVSPPSHRRRPRPRPPSRPRPRPTARSPPTRPPARLRPSRRRRRRASRSPRAPTARSRSRATS